MPKVEKFRSKLGDLGLLYSDFKSSQEIEDLIYRDCLKFVERIENKSHLGENEEESSPSFRPNLLDEIESIESKEGIYELNDAVALSMSGASSKLEAFGRLQNELNESMETKTKEMEGLAKLGPALDPQVFRSSIDSVANVISETAKKMAPELDDLRGQLEEGFNAVLRLSIDELVYDNEADRVELLGSLNDLELQVIQSKSSTANLIETISGMPGYTSRLKKAKGMIRRINEYYLEILDYQLAKISEAKQNLSR